MIHILDINGCPNFSSNSEKMTTPAPPITSERVSLPPGTSWGNFRDDDRAEYLSDHDIAAGRIPNSTNTNKNITREHQTNGFRSKRSKKLRANKSIYL